MSFIFQTVAESYFRQQVSSFSSIFDSRHGKITCPNDAAPSEGWYMTYLTVQINDLSLILIEFNQYLIYLKLRVGNEIGYSQVYSYNKIIIYS